MVRLILLRFRCRLWLVRLRIISWILVSCWLSLMIWLFSLVVVVVGLVCMLSWLILMICGVMCWSIVCLVKVSCLS